MTLRTALFALTDAAEPRASAKPVTFRCIMCDGTGWTQPPRRPYETCPNCSGKGRVSI